MVICSCNYIVHMHTCRLCHVFFITIDYNFGIIPQLKYDCVLLCKTEAFVCKMVLKVLKNVVVQGCIKKYAYEEIVMVVAMLDGSARCCIPVRYFIEED